MNKQATNHRAVLLTGLLVGCCAYTVVSLSSAESAPAEPSRTTASTVAFEVSDTLLPPTGVVREQMKALGNCRVDRGAMARVYAFASPTNKAATGPFERFDAMVWSPPYSTLINNRGWIIGDAVVRDDAAAVLVTMIDQQGQFVAFRFYLSRQKDESNRWMTDAVWPMRRLLSDELDAAI